jgi:hypothetical protein
MLAQAGFAGDLGADPAHHGPSTYRPVQGVIMHDARGNQAVVLGASMAGLLAARVLAERFEQVVVIERDPLPQLVWR